MPDKKSRETTIVSACLVGVRCVNYPSLMFEHEGVVELFANSLAIPLCSEQLGGLPTPRPPVGFDGGTAEDLWELCAGDYWQTRPKRERRNPHHIISMAGEKEQS